MANERMYLLHKPSGYYVYMSKRMGWGWYGVDVKVIDHINLLFEMVESQEATGDQDDFIIALDNDDRLIYQVTAPRKKRRKWWRLQGLIDSLMQ